MSGRAGGGDLARVELYVVLEAGAFEVENWLWFSVPITDHTKHWNRWESDTEIPRESSLLPEVLSNLSISANVHFVAVGLDDGDLFDLDIKTRAAADIPELEKEGETGAVEKDNAGGGWGVMVIAVAGVAILFLLMIIIVIARSFV